MMANLTPKPVQRPFRCFPDMGILVASEYVKNRQEPFLSTVAHRNRDVSQQACVFRPLDRCSAEHPAKILGTQSRQPTQFRIHHLGSRFQFRSFGYGRVAVPWTHVLANVTAKNLAPNSGAKTFRNASALLDRQIRDALSSVELIWGRKCVRGAGVETTRTRATPIRRRKIGRQLDRSEHDSEEEPRPKFLVQDASILGDPSNTGVLGENALNERPGIDIAPN